MRVGFIASERKGADLDRLRQISPARQSPRHWHRVCFGECNTGTGGASFMRILQCIEDQITATNLPLVGITLAAVPCPDTPVILTLHWHGFIKEKLIEAEEAE